MTKVFYDCEFNEDGETIELISIGAVTEHGSEFYAINGELDLDKLSRNQWLMENVVPSLPIETESILNWIGNEDSYVEEEALVSIYNTFVWNKATIRDRFKAFLESQIGELELWAWYGSYDHVSYAQLFGKMIDLPTTFPRYTNDLRQEVERIRKYVDSQVMLKLPVQEQGLHNALEDARHLKARYEWLKGEYQSFIKIL